MRRYLYRHLRLSQEICFLIKKMGQIQLSGLVPFSIYKRSTMQRRLLLVNIVAMVSTIICSIISAGCLSLAAYIGSENKKYKKLQQKQEDEHIGEIVSEQIKPIRDELKKLRDELFEVAAEEGDTRDELMSSWRFRLM